MGIQCASPQIWKNPSGRTPAVTSLTSSAFGQGAALEAYLPRPQTCTGNGRACAVWTLQVRFLARSSRSFHLSCVAVDPYFCHLSPWRCPFLWCVGLPYCKCFLRIAIELAGSVVAECAESLCMVCMLLAFPKALLTKAGGWLGTEVTSQDASNDATVGGSPPLPFSEDRATVSLQLPPRQSRGDKGCQTSRSSERSCTSLFVGARGGFCCLRHSSCRGLAVCKCSIFVPVTAVLQAFPILEEGWRTTPCGQQECYGGLLLGVIL